MTSALRAASAAAFCLMLWSAGTAGAQTAPASDETVIRAYVAAWNAGDSARVAALFAPDAEVTQRAPWLEDGGDRLFIRDSYGAELTAHVSELTFRGAEIVWARGRNDVALWAAGHLRDGHRLEIENVRADPSGDLTWTYRASTHIQRRIFGVSPTVGRVEATMAEGALRSLAFESDIASVQDRIRSIWNAADYIPLVDAPIPTEPPAAPGQTVPTFRVGPDDGDAQRIVAGSAVALVVLVLFAVRQSLGGRRPPNAS